MASRAFHVVPREVPPELTVRTGIAAAVVCIAFALIAARLWFLQLAIGDQMRDWSEKNRIRLVRVAAARGVVYDRHGEIVVDNRPSFDIVFVPEDARDRRQVLRGLAGYLRDEEVSLVQAARAPSRQRQRYEGIVLRRDVDWSSVVAVETHQLDLPGVSLEIGPRRYYPFGPMAAHLLGYVGEVSERELAEGTTGYRLGDLLGKSGLEKAYDDELRGDPGEQQVEVDALGRRVRVLGEEADVSGNTLTLTLDRDLQETAEQALGEHDGAIVALDPRNGEVLAMVSHPAYDPNVFARGVKADEWRGLMQHPKRPLNNRAVQGQYPPGSTFKIAVAAAAIESGRGGIGVSCSGGIPFGNHFFRCWKKGGHGPVNLHRGIVESCDVFFYTAGRSLGIERIADYARRLGLGIPTGIAMDHEKAGIIPDTAWKQKRFKQPWYEGETLSVAIGQGYVTATPLQMAHMAATVANGGKRFRPFYVKRVEAPDGTLLRDTQPEVMSEAGLKPSTIERLRAAMRDVVMTESGTGKKARVMGVSVGGKTGTSQVVKLGVDRDRSNKGERETRDHAWFIAFAPTEAPEIAVACIVEHAGGGGGAIAAPVVQQVLQRYFTRDAGPRELPTQEAHAVRPATDRPL